MRLPIHRAISIVPLFCAVTLAACALTHQARDVEKSGFLQDYSILREGKEGEALLVYENPDMDLTAYESVILEPISIWLGPDIDTEGVADEDLQRLVDDFYSSCRERLAENFPIVEEPGPGVLRIRVAITKVEESQVVLDTVSTVVPPARAISAVQRLATGTASFVGAASAECEVTDAETNELLLAAVDRRVGQKAMRDSYDSWGDVKAAFDYWAGRLAARLKQPR